MNEKTASRILQETLDRNDEIRRTLARMEYAMSDKFPPRPLPENPPADFGPIMAEKVRQDQIHEGAAVRDAREKAEVKRINAQATIAGAMSFMVVWFVFWFAAAVAVAGLRTAQYLWTSWPAGFYP